MTLQELIAESQALRTGAEQMLAVAIQQRDDAQRFIDKLNALLARMNRHVDAVEPTATKPAIRPTGGSTASRLDF